MQNQLFPFLSLSIRMRLFESEKVEEKIPSPQQRDTEGKENMLNYNFQHKIRFHRYAG